jgi:hypothetical protein
MFYLGIDPHAKQITISLRDAEGLLGGGEVAIPTQGLRQ